MPIQRYRTLAGETFPTQESVGSGPFQSLAQVERPRPSDPISSGNPDQVYQEDSASRAMADEFYARSNLGTGSFRPGNGSLDAWSPTDALPRTKRKQLQRADYWLGEDDMLASLIQVKTDFGLMGFALRPETSEELSNGKLEEPTEEEAKLAVKKRLAFRQWLDRFQKKWDLEKVLEDLLKDWFSKDTMILYWRLEKESPAGEEGSSAPDERSKEAMAPGLLEITSLNPSDCDWQDSFGQDRLKYYIPQDTIKTITAVMMQPYAERQRAIKVMVEAGVDMKFIQAVQDGKDYVYLDEADGDRWLVMTRNRKRHGIAKPSMYTIFLPLESRKAVSEGEHAASFMMKHFIMHATSGESITQGQAAGTRNLYAKPKEIDRLFEILQDPAKTTRMVTNHTVKINFVFPPSDMWDKKRYEKTEARILNWAGVTLVIMTGDGSTNAGGYLSIKRLISNLDTARRRLSLMFFEFFDQPEIRLICNIPEEYDVTADFNQNVLKEPRQILEEVKTIIGEGMGDPQVALEELGRNPRTIHDSKEESIEQNRTSHVWEPIYSKMQGGREGERQVKQDSKGRPANDSTQVNDETREQTPRAS